MPRFSVIVPVHRVRDFPRECLDAYAGRDPRVKALRLPRNVGSRPVSRFTDDDGRAAERGVRTLSVGEAGVAAPLAVPAATPLALS